MDREAEKLRATIALLESAGGLSYADRLEFARAAGDAGLWDLALAQAERALPLITREAVLAEYPSVKSVRPEKLDSDYRRVRQAAELMRGWALIRCGKSAEGLAAFATVEAETRYDILGLPENAIAHFHGQALLETGDFAGALSRLAPVALIGGRPAEQELLERAWRALHGSTDGFLEWCAEERRRRAPPVPDVTFYSLEGNAFSLCDLRGRVALLLFWFPSCSACREELPLVEPIWRRFGPDRFTAVAIDARRDREGAELFRRERGLTFPFVENGEGAEESVQSSFGISVFPVTWLVDRRFRVRQTWDWQNQPTAAELSGSISTLIAESPE